MVIFNKDGETVEKSIYYINGGDIKYKSTFVS